MFDNTDGYTPVSQAIIHECGPRAAFVWGVVWRYCQVADGVCWASQAAIGRRARLSRDTVRKYLRTLVQAGYLAEFSPNTPGATHAYVDTGRAGSPLRDPVLRMWHTKTRRASSPAPVARPSNPDPVGRVSNPALRAADDDPDDDPLDDQHDWSDEPLLLELLAEHFSRLTGVGQPRPRDEEELRQARALWADPLYRIAARCGSAAAGRAVITAAVAILRAKGCVVKAPISILSTAEALAARQPPSEGTADR